MGNPEQSGYSSSMSGQNKASHNPGWVSFSLSVRFTRPKSSSDRKAPLLSTAGMYSFEIQLSPPSHTLEW